jgi:hypothetical protein
MTENLKHFAIGSFLDFYKSDLESETVDENNVVLSFPVHFSGFHRIEVTITQVNSDHFLISDGAKTIEELRNAGYDVTSKLKTRIEKISRMAKLRIVDEYLVAESSAGSLGSSIQRFVEAAKTIGDAYLVQKAVPPKDTNLLMQVGAFLVSQSVPFQTKRSLLGKVEKHSIDFLFPPNGVPGLALSILPNPTRMTAEAWAFKASDIKAADTRMRVGVVYEAEAATTTSKEILRQSVDFSVPSSEISAIGDGMKSIGILKPI